MRAVFLHTLLLSIALTASAQKMQTPAGEAPGPWLLGTIGVGKQPDGTIKTTALKGIAIKVGEKGEAAVAYDLELCRMVGAWSGKFVTPMNLMSRGEYPTAMGEVAFTTGEVPGFVAAERSAGLSSPADQAGGLENPLLRDPRPQPFGPLPPGHARFKGFYTHGEKVILNWDIGGTEVLEMPRVETDQDNVWLQRHIDIGPSDRAIFVLIGPAENGKRESLFGQPLKLNAPAQLFATCSPRMRLEICPDLPRMERLARENPKAFAEEIARNEREGPSTESEIARYRDAQFVGREGFLWLRLPPGDTNTRLLVEIAPTASGKGAVTDERLAAFTKGGPTHFPDPMITAGELSKDTTSAYVVDTIKLPDPNPWNAPMFIGGLDFFADGRAAVCTFHGDVFVVSGIDEKLEKVTWRRFASGLYHALGLKIVKDEIYVTCRDGIYRLRDLNADGEADFYEAFNYDINVTKNFHEFVFDLQTDPQGNFYFAKAGPVKNGGRGFDQIVPHHGSILRVTPDGSKLQTVATGFRAPNGIGVGPGGELTSGENEGTWVPACKINWVREDGFNGVVDTAHRTPAPTTYDPPLCWLPRKVDNSGGSQVWVTSSKWGPWKDQMLHLSYGQCALFGVMKEEVFSPDLPDCCAHIMQGGVVRFPLNFQSGIMRARFHPIDGQLYVAGLRGWQTTGVKNGAFQRVRYTGAPVRMPIGLHATKRGLQIDFTCELDPATATDVGNWTLEQWNYIWSSAYGSPEVSTISAAETPGEAGKDGRAEFTKAQMSKSQRDPVEVKSARLSADKRSVFLEIPAINPVMQMSIGFNVRSADGAELKQEIVNTIHVVSEEALVP